jgi:hypothetical protein
MVGFSTVCALSQPYGISTLITPHEYRDLPKIINNLDISLSINATAAARYHTLLSHGIDLSTQA